MAIPDNLKREKGWVGQLLEWHLGAESGSKPQPDFEHLGIELKTIPIGYSGKPLETTFVSVAPLTGVHGLTWEDSHVRHKLSRVLWIPIEGEREDPGCRSSCRTTFNLEPDLRRRAATQARLGGAIMEFLLY